MFKIVLVALFLLALAFGVEQPILATASAKTKFERTSSELPFFLLSDFLYARKGSVLGPGPDELAKYQSLLNEAVSDQYKRTVLLPLLKHSDAKVRTLAIAALFNKNDPAVLPYILPLAQDNAPTYKTYALRAYVNRSQILPPDEQQTVDTIARKCLEFYMERAGYYYGLKARKEVRIAPGETYGGFDDYWQKRQHRHNCASWYEVRIDRTYGGSTPVKAELVPKIKSIVAEILQLPEPDRAYTLLYLSSNDGAKTIVNETMLLKECRQVKRANLIDLLRRQIDSTDPDLQPRNSNNYRYTAMMNFILSHADELLRKEDIPKLLACQSVEEGHPTIGIADPNKTALWTIAVAKLDKANARNILFDCVQSEEKLQYRANNCALLAEAIAELLGPKEDGFFVNYFYTATDQGELTTFQQACVTNMAKLDGARREQLLKAIVADNRYSSAHIWVMMSIVQNLSSQLGEKKMNELWSRLQQLPWSYLDPKSAQAYPKEAHALHIQIDEITKELRHGLSLN